VPNGTGHVEHQKNSLNNISMSYDDLELKIIRGSKAVNLNFHPTGFEKWCDYHMFGLFVANSLGLELLVIFL
jgi:hypothetical protein